MILIGFLSHNVNVHGRRVAQKPIDRIQVADLAPPSPADLPKIIWVTCFSRTNCAAESATLFPFRRTGFAPRLSANCRLASSDFLVLIAVSLEVHMDGV